MSDPAFFLVASAGFSGSKWFAAALDRHPDILCTHSAGDFQIWDRRYSAEEFDRCTEEEWIHRAKKPLDDYLAQLAARGDAKVYGNVHRYRVCDIAELMRGQAPTTRFVIANLVRHPVLWTQSARLADAGVPLGLPVHCIAPGSLAPASSSPWPRPTSSCALSCCTAR